MLFNSIEFLYFFPIVFILYWFLFNKNLRMQNSFIVVSSFVFYGWWDWRFLFLMIFSASIDFFTSIGISRTGSIKKKRILLFTSILTNLGILGFFKYFNFFAENFVSAFTILGYHADPVTIKIILPVGISFYTFQALSYTIDVYKGKLLPTNDIISYFSFISFFPQLVAGPIERATNLLPQFYQTRKFNELAAKDGLRQMLWGLFKKIVVADNCAFYVNEIFNNYQDYSGSTLVLGAVLFAVQIYCDFSGYSDIAIGSAKLLGFSLMRNFAYPYFSRNIAEFWRRWHISLSTWFRDYVYIPLGGSQGSFGKKIRNTFIIFILSGFWHGANWTFLFWGFLNALYFLPLLILNRNRIYLDVPAGNSHLPNIKEFTGIFFTFSATVLAWVFFRSNDLSHAFNFLRNIFTVKLFSLPVYHPLDLAIIIPVFFSIEWMQRKQQHALVLEHLKISKILRWVLYYLLIAVILFYGGPKQQFIYFQF